MPRNCRTNGKRQSNFQTGTASSGAASSTTSERARKRLSLVLPLTIGIIFVLLFFAFGSTKDAGLVLLNVPFSLVGGILFLWLRGINLSVSAAVGFVSLFGVAVMSGVLVVSEINRRMRYDNTSFHDAVIAGALAQLRPVLMMIVVAMIGMVPAARATGIDVQRRLATVVVGGLASTLFLTFLALPALSSPKPKGNPYAPCRTFPPPFTGKQGCRILCSPFRSTHESL